MSDEHPIATPIGGGERRQQARTSLQARVASARSGTAEQQRLDDAVAGRAPWQRWGTYISERAWGTVREDYSANGDAWHHFPYDAARSRAYRWNEDALAGWCDQAQTLCFGLGLWNGVDDHLKERPFGLTNEQGNHGEDAKDYWFYTDNTPTHSYASMVYKYPQAPFPYADLIATNAGRGPEQPEYELFDALETEWRANRYFDTLIEFAKADPEDVIVCITATNRGPDPAPLHLLWQAWFRNVWSWEIDGQAPTLRRTAHGVELDHPVLGRRWLYAHSEDAEVRWLFCDNESNLNRLFGVPNTSDFPKDGINDAVVHGVEQAVNADAGSKAAAVITTTVAPGDTCTLWFRFSPSALAAPFADAADVVRIRHTEADEYYAAWQRRSLSDDEKLVQRQAIAGLLWCKQFYNFHVTRWLRGDPTAPPPPAERWAGRNAKWKHIVNEDILLMPDAWEYPWYATWDSAFHIATIAMVDPNFAKQQTLLLTSSLYQHPHGELPAYEWDFSNTNPPVLAWAAWQVYLLDAASTGVPDRGFLAAAYRGLLLCLTSWMNTQDPLGKDLFAGGFLGMDNIGIFNRDHQLPTGGQLVQSDGTAWVAQLVGQMAEIALELSRHAPGYDTDLERLLLDFAMMCSALEKGRDGVSLWNDDAGFYCDAIAHPDGSATQLGVISMQSLIPILATVAVAVDTEGVGSEQDYGLAPALQQLRRRVLAHHPEYHGSVSLPPGSGDGSAMLFAVVRPERLRRILAHLLDPAELLSDYGIRSLSAAYREQPYEFRVGDQVYSLPYWPAESRNRMFGGNSNWRGPIWFPINLLLLQSLLDYDSFFGDTFTVEFPTGSGHEVRLREVVVDVSNRLTSIFVRGADGRRVVLGNNDYFQTDPHWRDLVPFYEYFDGDDGRGCGASHQTGWTATVAILLQLGGRLRIARS